ncbi:glycosyltransferase family 4 protein [Ornithinimicrobium pratense]|uniref:Glycosyltransferase family 4 protein n=1 Tax=Ornithinimicrobium pratense TaxID=2593973 RepID=A0A5J6V358_9MICO|nr:glycosyltransferase family 4 protein [Ornithinimicrobium pratense]QFG68360.1 glycosyltransferase family 4 protein [Ornithinimicrobium pratense]
MNDTRPSLLIISYSRLFRDARVLRQIRLFRDDYAVTTVGYGPAPEGVVAHHQVPDEIIYWHVDRKLVVARIYQRAFDTAPITRWAREQLVGQEYDVILANDLQPVPVAIEMRPRGGVHVDLHEYVTRQKEEVWRFRTFLAPYYGYLIKKWVRRANSVTTVGFKLAEQYEAEFGVPCGVVFNAPERRELTPGEVADPVRLVHAGGATPGRLEMMLAAVEQVQGGATLDLFLVDSGSGYAGSVRERYVDHPRIHVHDAVPTSELVNTLHRYDVGVHILAPVSFNHRYAMPNKIFDYVQARLGVLIGPSPEMAALVREHSVGWVSQGFTAADVARTIDGLTRDDVARAKGASDVAARVLCAEEQVAGWAEPVRALARKAG